jgi:hypothetical protein
VIRIQNLHPSILQKHQHQHQRALLLPGSSDGISETIIGTLTGSKIRRRRCGTKSMIADAAIAAARRIAAIRRIRRR